MSTNPTWDRVLSTAGRNGVSHSCWTSHPATGIPGASAPHHPPHLPRGVASACHERRLSASSSPGSDEPQVDGRGRVPSPSPGREETPSEGMDVGLDSSRSISRQLRVRASHARLRIRHRHRKRVRGPLHRLGCASRPFRHGKGKQRAEAEDGARAEAGEGPEVRQRRRWCARDRFTRWKHGRGERSRSPGEGSQETGKRSTGIEQVVENQSIGGMHIREWTALGWAGFHLRNQDVQAHAFQREQGKGSCLKKSTKGTSMNGKRGSGIGCLRLRLSRPRRRPATRASAW